MKLMCNVICMNSSTLKDQMNELKMSAINACVNIPSVFTPILLTSGDKDLVLKNLFDLLDDEMSVIDEYDKFSFNVHNFGISNILGIERTLFHYLLF